MFCICCEITIPCLLNVPFRRANSLSLQLGRSQFNAKDVRFIRSCVRRKPRPFASPSGNMSYTRRRRAPGAYACERRKPRSPRCTYTRICPVLVRVLVRSRVARGNASAPTTVAQTVSIYVRIKMLGYQIRARVQAAGRSEGKGMRKERKRWSPGKRGKIRKVDGVRLFPV